MSFKPVGVCINEILKAESSLVICSQAAVHLKEVTRKFDPRVEVSHHWQRPFKCQYLFKIKTSSCQIFVQNKLDLMLPIIIMIQMVDSNGATSEKLLTATIMALVPEDS